LATSPRNPIFFVDDPGKLYRQRRRATQAKGLETLDSKVKLEGPSKSPRESPPPSQDAGRPFKIKVSTIRMTIVRAECIRAGFLEWHIGLLKRRMKKMEIEEEALHLKAAKARSTCEDLSAHRDEDARDASGTTCRAPDG
jgi:hypothetical protein